MHTQVHAHSRTYPNTPTPTPKHVEHRWATYGQVKRSLNNQLSEDSQGRHRLFVQSFAGVCAGVTAATLTNPMDVIKTRIQVGSSSFGLALSMLNISLLPG